MFHFSKFPFKQIFRKPFQFLIKFYRIIPCYLFLFLFSALCSLCFLQIQKKFGCFFILFVPLAFTSYFNAFSNIMINSSSYFLQLIYSAWFISRFRFYSKHFIWFSRKYCLLFFAFAKSFENLIAKQPISYFNTSHFTWLQNCLLQFNSSLILQIRSFSFDTFSSFDSIKFPNITSGPLSN